MFRDIHVFLLCSESPKFCNPLLKVYICVCLFCVCVLVCVHSCRLKEGTGHSGTGAVYVCKMLECWEEQQVLASSPVPTLHVINHPVL